MSRVLASPAAVLALASCAMLPLPTPAPRAPDRSPAGGDHAVPSEAEARLIALINRERRQRHIPELRTDRRLVALARAHSADMERSGYFGHESPTEGNLRERMQQARYVARAFAENVARAGSIDRVHAGLMASPGHRANILAGGMTHVGVGVVRGREGLVATEIFADPRSPGGVAVRAAGE